LTQLIINGISLPQTNRDKFSCYPALLSESLEMISGRVVQEVRGKVWRITYSYDYMGNDLMRQALSVLRAGKSFPVTFLPDNSDAYQSSIFRVNSITQPTFAFSKSGKPYWHNFSFTLREVKPHA